MALFAMAIMFVGGIWAGVYLVVNNHPWFGLFVLLIVGSLRYTSKSDVDENKKQ